MKKEIEQFQAQNVERIRKALVTHVEKVNGFNVVKAVLPIQANVAKDLVFKIREQIPEKLLCVIGSTAQEKPLLTVILSEDMVKEYGFNAGQIVREAAKLIKGGGGGQPHFASAGGKDLEGIHAAVDAVINSIKHGAFAIFYLSHKIEIAFGLPFFNQHIVLFGNIFVYNPTLRKRHDNINHLLSFQSGYLHFLEIFS
jgi:hypothetical protein